MIGRQRAVYSLFQKKIIISVLCVLINCIAAYSNPLNESGVRNFGVEDTCIQKYNGPVITEEQAIESALENSATLQSLHTHERIAEYHFKSAGKFRNPELRLSDVDASKIGHRIDEYELGVRLRFPTPGELGEDKQKANVELWERKVAHLRYRQLLIAEIRRDYANVIISDHLAELAYQHLKKEEERLNTIEHLVEIGRRSIIHFTKAKIWYAESQNNYIRALEKQHLERLQLARRSDIPEDAQLVESDLPEVKQSLDELIALAIQNRVEPKLAEQRISLFLRQQKYERFKLLPHLTFIEFSRHYEKKNWNNWNEWKLGIELPLFDWNIYNIMASNLAVAKKDKEYGAIKEIISNEVEIAYKNYRNRLMDWKSFKMRAEDLIRNTRKVVSEAKVHKLFMPDEVIEMELTIIDTQKLLYKKRRNLAHALIDLYFAIGIESHEQLK